MKLSNIVAVLWLGYGVIAASGCADEIRPDASSAFNGGTAAVVTYAQVKPIFMNRCGPCHAGMGTAAAANSLADSAATARLAASNPECAMRTKGECAYIRMRSGSMPPRAMFMCTGDPAQDAGKAKCLTQEEQVLMYGWITGGLQ